MKRLDFGEIFHEHLLVRVLKWKYGDLIKDERGITITVDPYEIYMRGYIDDLIFFKIPNSDGAFIALPVEVKSYSGSLKYLKTPKLEYLYQVMVYMVATGSRIGKIVYVQMNGISDDDANGDPIGVTKTFTIEFDPLIYAELEQRARFIHENRINGDLVPPPEARLARDKKKQCNYCDFKQACDKFVKKYKYFKAETDGTWESLKTMMPDDFYDKD